jgi:hypothetical protein
MSFLEAFEGGPCRQGVTDHRVRNPEHLHHRKQTKCRPQPHSRDHRPDLEFVDRVAVCSNERGYAVVEVAENSRRDDAFQATSASLD